MTAANVSSDWAGGNQYLYDKSRNVIAYWDGTNRKLVIPSGSALEVDGVTVDSSTLALNGLTASAAELNLNDGTIAGTAVASKTLALDANKAVDALRTAQLLIGASGSEVDKTNVIIGAASGYKIARSATPLALDGSNPTSAAHGLTTCIAAFATLAGSAAPGLSTSLVTVVINGANLDFYAWKPTGAGDTTLVASTGTETFNWFAIGT